jgi:hypothetical protein
MNGQVAFTLFDRHYMTFNKVAPLQNIFSAFTLRSLSLPERKEENNVYGEQISCFCNIVFGRTVLAAKLCASSY